jgi:tetratricopeptide (TPR) repeat protein
MKWYAALLLGLLPLLSCGHENGKYKEELQGILDVGGEPRELKARLLELDQRIPDKAMVKINLGILSLTLGEIEEAGVYLRRAHELAYELNRAKLTTEERYLLLSGLAEYAYKAERFEEAGGFARQALEVDAQDGLGDRLILARVEYRRRENQEAEALYRQVWDSGRKYMNREDYDALFVLLLSSQQWELACDVLQAYMRKFGYEYGLGVKTSALLEKGGKINASILAAFTDLRYGLFRGLVDRGMVDGDLEELRRKLQAESWTYDNRGEKVLSALRAVMGERWAEAAETLSGIAGETDQSSPLVRFWFLVAGMEAGDDGALGSYIEEEVTFRGYPEYPYRLWRALKRRASGYSLARAKPILENAVYSSRGTAFGLESRRELGRLMGLSPSDSDRLLVGAEIQDLAEQFRRTGEMQYDEPLLQALGIENNDYTRVTEVTLRRLAAASADLRAHLLSRRAEAAGNLRLRLDNVIN